MRSRRMKQTAVRNALGLRSALAAGAERPLRTSDMLSASTISWNLISAKLMVEVKSSSSTLKVSTQRLSHTSASFSDMFLPGSSTCDGIAKSLTPSSAAVESQLDLRCSACTSSDSSPVTPKSDREILVLFASRARRRTSSGAPVSATGVKLTSTGYCGFLSDGLQSEGEQRWASPSHSGLLPGPLNRGSLSPVIDSCLLLRGVRRKESGDAGCEVSRSGVLDAVGVAPLPDEVLGNFCHGSPGCSSGCACREFPTTRPMRRRRTSCTCSARESLPFGAPCCCCI